MSTSITQYVSVKREIQGEIITTSEPFPSAPSHILQKKWELKKKAQIFYFIWSIILFVMSKYY